MKKIKKTFLYLFGFALALLAFTIIINLPVFDEDLLPEVQAIKEINAEPYSEDNAYPAFLAINGASGPALKQASEVVRKRLNQQIKETGKDFLSNDAYEQLIGNGHDNSWKNTYHSCRSRTDLGCMNALVNDLLVNPIIDDRLVSQLHRYEVLLTYPNFSDARILKFDSPLVAFGSIMNLQKLYLSNAYIKMDSAAYLTAWQKDHQFWRMVMSKSHLLITKMVAIAAMRTNIDSLSTALKHGAIGSDQLIELQNSIPSLTHTETNFPITFEYEFKYGMSKIDENFESENSKTFMDTLGNLFYQHQATHNINYLFVTQKLIQFSQMDASQFHQHTSSEKFKEAKTSPFTWYPTTLYNPVGKLLISYAMPAYKDYIGRGHDLTGVVNLLRLQIEIALKPEQAADQVIAESQYTNPYTLKPMNYNKDKHSIYFECMDTYSVCELSL